VIAHTPPRAPNRDYDQVLDVDRVHGRDYGKRAEHDRASAVDLNALPGDIDARRALPQRAAGFHDATGDSKTVARWWDRWTHANIGVLTDPTSRLVVVLDRPRRRHHLAHRRSGIQVARVDTFRPPCGACAAAIQCYYVPVVSVAEYRGSGPWASR
jgi:hypothetical protein